MQDKRVDLNGVKVYPFASEKELLDYVDSCPGILVAINAEKILHATDQTRAIINRNIGYCDGSGAVMALKQKGYKEVRKIAGCELWLKIIAYFYRQKTFYLVGGKQQVIEETVEKLNKEYEGIRIVGWRNGYLKSDEEHQALIDDIVAKKDVTATNGKINVVLSLVDKDGNVLPTSTAVKKGETYTVTLDNYYLGTDWAYEKNLSKGFETGVTVNVVKTDTTEVVTGIQAKYTVTRDSKPVVTDVTSLAGVDLFIKDKVVITLYNVATTAGQDTSDKLTSGYEYVVLGIPEKTLHLLQPVSAVEEYLRHRDLNAGSSGNLKLLFQGNLTGESLRRDKDIGRCT